MSSLPPRDPLVSLWQTTPKPETHQLLHDLQRLNRLHERFNRTILGLLFGISLLLIFEEATGRVATHGRLSAIWILGLLLGVFWRRRVQCKRADAISMDTISLLKFMIARAKSDLFVARCLYAGVPCGALAGFFVLKLARGGPSSSAIATHPHLHFIQAGAGIAVLIAMMVIGVILARSRRVQVQELSEKLRLIEGDL
jgi:hypothetical protein